MSADFGDGRLPERFWTKAVANDDTGCWRWVGCLSTEGYARFRLHGETQYGHRVAYLALVAPHIPKGLHIDHLCRDRACVNPAHLEVVTPRENMLRGESPAARVIRSGNCKKGHARTPENIYVDKITGWKACRPCHAIRELERRQRREVA